MKNQIFFVFILFMFTVITQSYYHFKNHFNDADFYKSKVASMEYKLKQEKLKTDLSEYSLKEFKSQVASLLPENIELKTNQEDLYPLRGLASVVRKQNNLKLADMLAINKFNKAKSLFSLGRFYDANKIFKDIIINYSYSADIVEVYFLSSEAHYQLNDSEEAVRLINTMINLYPSSELTGFAMLRLGKIFEKQERYGEATGIYRTVLKSFDNKDLSRQSLSSLKATKL